jgi:meso-butanediol dehydrogenase / (S,S)-butanediol dehydrogenase / diacetyl reductase
MDLHLEGKVALVTGGGQGVGRGIALALAAEGAAVAISGRTEEKLVQVADEIAARGGTAISIVADVTDASDVERTVAATVGDLGGLDILVNNAHQPPMGTLLSIDEDALDAGWRSGPLAVFRFMKVAYPYLKGGGVIINLGSNTSINPQATGRGVYSALKSAITTLTRTAAIEWGADGIRAITVMPAAMSPAAEAFSKNSPEEFARSLSMIPLRRLGDCEIDIGRPVAFLCSDAGAYITGTVITLDGGHGYLR